MHANPLPLLGTAPAEAPADPRWNALKHGLHSAAILLPGDDGSEFRRRRLALFHTYLPQTEDEAECVDSMAEMRWRLQRCRHMQAAYDAQVLALATDAAGRLCEPDGHQRLHSSMDVTVHQQRIDKLLCRARTKLLELQKLRRQGLVAGAPTLAPDCYLEVNGDVVSLALTDAPPPGEEIVSTHPSTPSDDGQNRDSPERRGARVPTRQEDPRGRLIGGFAGRRIFAEAATPRDDAGKPPTILGSLS